MNKQDTSSLVFSTGQVSKLTGVNIETIRFYEKRGLLSKPKRTPSQYRQFSTETLQRLRFILRAKELGFSLSEIKELLTLKVSGKRAQCGDVKRKATNKIAEIETKIKTLNRMKDALSRLVSACSGDGSISKCPILEALDETDTSVFEK